MPVWSKITVGLVLAIALLGLAGLRASSGNLGRIDQPHGTTFYNGQGPKAPPLPCKPESDIRSAIVRVHAKYDLFDGARLDAFEQRSAAHLKRLASASGPIPSSRHVWMSQLRLDGKNWSSFTGLTRRDCVSTVIRHHPHCYTGSCSLRA